MKTKKVLKVKSMIPPTTAVKSALKALQDRGFLKLEFLQETLSAVKPNKSVLVQLLDDPE